MLLKKLSSKENIESAFKKAINERAKNEHAMLRSEIAYAENNENEYLDNIQFELSSISHYSPEAGFYYSMPKSEIVDRFIVYLPLKELIIRYAFIQIILVSIDDQLIDNCFANRLSDSDDFLTQNYGKESWPNYCAWQKQQAYNHEQMIVTDLSGYYDCISHEKLISIIAKRMGINESDPFLIYFGRILQQKVMLDDGSGDFIEVKRGLITGPCCEGVLGNIYLSELDDILSKFEGVEYGRYVDDIRLFSNDESSLKSAFNILQSEMKKLELHLNSSKTEYKNENKQVVRLFEELCISYNHYGEEEEDVYERIATLPASEIETDLSFEERKPEFNREEIIENAKEAANFCAVLNKLKSKEWTKIDITNLMMIFKKFPSASKFAAWLIVKPIVFNGLDNIQKLAINNIFNEILLDEKIHPYAKSRIIHHLIKKKEGGHFYLLDCVEENSGYLNRKTIYIGTVIDNLCKCMRNSSGNLLLIIYCLDACKILNCTIKYEDMLDEIKELGINRSQILLKAIKNIDLHNPDLEIESEHDRAVNKF